MELIENWERLSTVVVPFLSRCGAAALCGALVGVERELKGKPAGLRTNMLICVGAAIYTAVGMLLVEESGSPGDPGRIAAQVVTGIGFLGAGAIIQERGRVTGLTTAATIWVVAAIGLVAGAGFPVLAVACSLMVLLTLTVIGKFEKEYFERDNRGSDGSP